MADWWTSRARGLRPRTLGVRALQLSPGFVSPTNVNLPVTIDADLASELRDRLRTLVEDLTAIAVDSDLGLSPGLRDAFAVIVRTARELDVAVLPPGTGLPSDDDLTWIPSAHAARGCPVPVALEFEPARDLCERALVHSKELNRILGQIQLRTPSRKAPPDLVRRFGFVMGYLFTELCMPLYRQHPSLEPEWLRSE